MSTDTCGARRPGWSAGPAVGIRRIPCVLDSGHAGNHENGFCQQWPNTEGQRAESPTVAIARRTLAEADEVDFSDPRAMAYAIGALRESLRSVLGEVDT